MAAVEINIFKLMLKIAEKPEVFNLTIGSRTMAVVIRHIWLCKTSDEVRRSTNWATEAIFPPYVKFYLMSIPSFIKYSWNYRTNLYEAKLILCG